MLHARGLAKDNLSWPGRKWRKLAKKAKHSDAVMTGILVTRFKMGQIDVEDLEEMAADTTWAERCSAAKKVLEAVRDSPDLQRQEEALRTPAPLLQRH
jgi:hypothetical protein